MSDSEKIDRIRGVVAEILDLDPGELTAESGVDVTGEWDSLRHLTIMMEVEQQFGHEFSPEDLAEAQTIAAIAARLP